MERTESRNRSKLRDFYKSQARENAELVRNPQFNLDSSQFNKNEYIDGGGRRTALPKLVTVTKFGNRYQIGNLILWLFRLKILEIIGS